MAMSTVAITMAVSIVAITMSEREFLYRVVYSEISDEVTNYAQDRIKELNRLESSSERRKREDEELLYYAYNQMGDCYKVEEFAKEFQISCARARIVLEGLERKGMVVQEENGNYEKVSGFNVWVEPSEV